MDTEIKIRPLASLTLPEQLARVEACVRADAATYEPGADVVFGPCAACDHGPEHEWHGTLFVALRERAPLLLVPLTAEQVVLLRQVATIVGAEDPEAADSILRGASTLAHRAIATGCHAGTAAEISAAALGQADPLKAMEPDAVALLRHAWTVATDGGREVDLNVLSDAIETINARFGVRRGNELRALALREIDGLRAAAAANDVPCDGPETDPAVIRERAREERDAVRA